MRISEEYNNLLVHEKNKNVILRQQSCRTNPTNKIFPYEFIIDSGFVHVLCFLE